MPRRWLIFLGRERPLRILSVASRPSNYVKNSNHFPWDWQPRSNSEPNLPKYLLCKQIKQRSILKM